LGIHAEVAENGEPIIVIQVERPCSLMRRRCLPSKVNNHVIVVREVTG
jgi:hypothetical protein